MLDRKPAGYSYIEREGEKSVTTVKEDESRRELVQRASRFTSTPASNSIPLLLFPDSGGCYRPPHRCAPMNFNSCPSDPGEKEHRKYIFLLFFVRHEIKRERRPTSRWKRECFARWRWLFSIVRPGRSISLVHSCTLPAIKIHIRTSSPIFNASFTFIRPRVFIESRVFIDTNGIVEANWKFVSLAKASIDRSDLVSSIFLISLAIARGDKWRDAMDEGF